MIYVNKAFILGYVGNDPEFKVTPKSATQCARFSVACTKHIKAQDGATEDRTQWHNVVLWGKSAEIAKRSGLAKGKPIYIEGEITYRQWTDNEGFKHYITEIVGERIQVLPKFPPQNSQGNAQGATQPTEPQGYHEGDEDLPF